MANFWEDEEKMALLGAFGSGLLESGSQNKSFGAALGYGGRNLLAQLQQQKQNKMNERRLGVEEGNLAVQRQKLQAELDAAQALAERQREFRTKLVGGPQVGKFDPNVMTDEFKAAVPAINAMNAPDPTFAAMLTPSQRAMLANIPMDKAAGMAEKMMTPGDMKFYTVPGSDKPVPLRQLGSGIFVDMSGKPVLPEGITPYEKPEYVTITEGAGGDMRRDVRVPARQAFEGSPYKSGQSINVNTGEKKAEELTLKQALDWSEKYVAQRPIIQSVARMEQATKEGTFTGLTAPGAMGAVSFLNGIGVQVSPDKFSNSRAFQAAGNQMALDFMAANGGARGFTEKETAMLLDAFPKLADSVQARKQIFDLMRSKADQVQTTYKGMYERMQANNPDAAKYLEPPVEFQRAGFQDSEKEKRYQEWKRKQGAK